MKSIILVFISILISLQTEAQSTFHKTYGGTEMESSYGLIETFDSAYIIVGYTKSYGAGNEDIYIIKTDLNGDTIWTKTYGSEYLDIAYDVQETLDSCYIICGKFSNSEAEMYIAYLLKINSQGDLLWTKEFDGPNSYIAQSVVVTDENGFIMICNECWDAGYTCRLLVIKTNSLGDTLWTKTFTEGEVSTGGNQIIKSLDGNFVITGLEVDLYEEGDPFVIKLDSEGNTIWTKHLNSICFTSPHSIVQNFDSSYIIAGVWYNGPPYDEYRDYLCKIDKYGTHIWTQNGDIGAFYFVEKTNDNNLIISGRNRYYKVNLSGGFIWSKDIYSSSGKCCRQTSDGNYLITGYHNYDIFLRKTNDEGLIITSINENNISNTINTSIFPNPCKDFVYIATSENDRKINLFNSQGSIVKTRMIVFENISSGKIKLDVSELRKGVYYLEIENPYHPKISKIIIQ